MKKWYLGVAAAAIIAAAPMVFEKVKPLDLSQAVMTMGILAPHGPSITKTAYTSTGYTKITAGTSGDYTFKCWGGGGGGGGGDSTAGAAGGGGGGSGAFVQFDYTLDGAKEYVIAVGHSGNAGANNASGGGGAQGGGLSGLFESGTVTSVEASTTSWSDTTNSITKSDNGDGTWRWTFPTSANTTTNASSLSITRGKLYILRMRVYHVSGASGSGLRIGHSGDFQIVTTTTGAWVTFETIWIASSTTTISIQWTNTPGTAPVYDIDYITLTPLNPVGIAAGGGGGGGGSGGSTAAGGGYGAGGGDGTTAKAGANGVGTSGGVGGSGATSSTEGAGGTGGGSGADGAAGDELTGGAGAGGTTYTVTGGGAGNTRNGTIAGPGGGGAGIKGGGGGEKSQVDTAGSGGGGSGASGFGSGVSNTTITAGNNGTTGGAGSAGTGGAAVNTGDADYAGGAGAGANGGQSSSPGTAGNGRVVMIG